jgi:hypothetical protein
MDWRHVDELLAAEQAIFSELKNICVWNKSNARDGERTVPMPAIAAIFRSQLASGLKGTAPPNGLRCV